MVDEITTTLCFPAYMLYSLSAQQHIVKLVGTSSFWAPTSQKCSFASWCSFM